MKKIICMESFAGYPDTEGVKNTKILEASVNAFAPMPAEYGYIAPAYVIDKSYGSRSSWIGSVTADGTTYRGLVESGNYYYGHVTFNLPKMELDSNKRLWVGCRISSTKFKNNVPLVGFLSSSSTVMAPAVGEGSYYLEVAVDVKAQCYYIYRNKELIQTLAFTGGDKNYIPQAKGAVIHMGNGRDYGTSVATDNVCYSDLYVAIETWGADETAPALTPFGPVRVRSRKVTKVDAANFSTNNDSKEAAVQFVSEPTSILNTKPLFTDPDGGVGKFEFSALTETHVPLAFQVTMAARRGVSSIGKLMSNVTDGKSTVKITDSQPPLQTNTNIPSYVYCSDTKLDGTPLDGEYINKLSVEAHSEEG